MNADESDNKNEATPKKSGGFGHPWNYRDVGKQWYQ
jgi:hypothetical protein